MSNIEQQIESSNSQVLPLTGTEPAPPPPPPPSRPRQPISASIPTLDVTSAPPRVQDAMGVGEAKGVRWRGELEDLNTDEETLDEKANDQSGSDDASEDREEDISRKAPPWLISLIFHLALLVILGLISTPVGEGLGRVLITLGESSGDSEEALAEFSIQPVDALQDAESEFNDDAPIDFDTPLEISNLLVEDSQELVDTLVGEGPKLELANPMFGGRRGATKEELLKRFGGTPVTVKSVAMGLAWLKRNQNRAGYWSMRGPYKDGVRSENRIAATAMAVLAFLGDGHTHREGDYMPEVHKGLKFLVNEQQRNGFFCKNVRGNDESAYAQAQASIAVCEAYAMTGDSWLRPYAQAALDYCVDSQSATGGWRYRYQDIEGDMSVTGWFVMALQSGRACEDLEIDEKVFYNLERFMKSVSLNGGSSYGYLPGFGETAAMSAEGLLVRQYTGWQRDHNAMKAGIKNLLDNYLFDIRQRDVYYWYYGTQVLHHYGGSAWQIWNDEMRKLLPAEQIKRGAERGSWAPQGDKWGDRGGGRLFQTCLSIYCLEVYYRHMPLYDMGVAE